VTASKICKDNEHPDNQELYTGRSSRLLKFLFASPTEAFQPDKSRVSDCFLSDFFAGNGIIHPVSGHQTD
jgi:hypothetical protein